MAVACGDDEPTDDTSSSTEVSTSTGFQAMSAYGVGPVGPTVGPGGAGGIGGAGGMDGVGGNGGAGGN